MERGFSEETFPAQEFVAVLIVPPLVRPLKRKCAVGAAALFQREQIAL